MWVAVDGKKGTVLDSSKIYFSTENKVGGRVQLPLFWRYTQISLAPLPKTAPIRSAVSLLPGVDSIVAAC